MVPVQGQQLPDDWLIKASVQYSPGEAAVSWCSSRVNHHYSVSPVNALELAISGFGLYIYVIFVGSL